MLSNILHSISPDLIKFILVAILSLLIGLEQRRLHIDVAPENLFGSDRTFTLIGILGFVLYVISPHNILPFLGGGAVIGLLLSVFYFEKIQLNKMFGATTALIALITYCLAPLVYTQPLWMALLIVVCVLVLTEIKETLLQLSEKFDDNEFITLAKFIIMAGVILPLLSNEPVSPEINISPYGMGLAIIAVSAISYFSYLLKKFVFPGSGIMLTGILGGLYSSTATTVILAKKSKEGTDNKKIVPALLLSTAMMYVRLFVLVLLFNQQIAMGLLPYFGILTVVCLALAYYFEKYRKLSSAKPTDDQSIQPHSNPLEIKTALFFGVLFIIFAIATSYVSKNYGGTGINVMAFLVGVTDIAPFVLGLLQSKLAIGNTIIVMAILNASTSNNVLKLIYALVLSDKALRKELIISFSIIILLGIALALLAPHL